ncbi:MAG: hypothetical protein ACRDHP_11855 [Ktedonobacterales bacterium]
MDNQSNIGAHAIQPHLPSIPAFTEEDVRTYVATHSVPGGGISSVKPPTVTKVAFMTTREASELIYNFISWRKEDLLCYVELEGAFRFAGGPPGYVSRYATTPADTRVFEILDAQTGNCLVRGFLPVKSDRPR